MALCITDPAAILGQSPAAHAHSGRRKTQVLQFIVDTLNAGHEPPSYGMICTELNITSRADVCRIVQRLERDGFITRSGIGRQRRIGVA